MSRESDSSSSRLLLPRAAGASSSFRVATTLNSSSSLLRVRVPRRGPPGHPHHHSVARANTTAPARASKATRSSSSTSSQLWSPGECIEVPPAWQPEEGEQLSGQLRIGRHLGAGSTADVFALEPVQSAAAEEAESLSGPTNANDCNGGASKASAASSSKQAQAEGAAAAGPGGGQVLKWSKPLPGAARAFRRDWALGRRLNAAAQAEPALRILLQTGPAVVSRNGGPDSTSSSGGHGGLSSAKKQQQRQQALVFRGVLLPVLRGASLDKRLEQDASFCDVIFILACLQTVLEAVDRGEALAGFRHGDLRISNIMEDILDTQGFEALQQNPEQWRTAGYQSAASAALDRGLLAFKLIDWGHSEISESRSRSLLLSAQQGDGAGAAADNPYLADAGAAADSLALERMPAAKGLVERVYTFFYKDKSDAWRLLHSLAPRLDGRAWPERRQQQLLALYRLMDEVLGTRLQASFFSNVETMPDGSQRRRDAEERVQDPAGPAGATVPLQDAPVLALTAAPRRSGWRRLRWLRDVFLRLWSRFLSRQPRVTAAELLARMRGRGLLVLGPDGRLLPGLRGGADGDAPAA